MPLATGARALLSASSAVTTAQGTSRLPSRTILRTSNNAPQHRPHAHHLHTRACAQASTQTPRCRPRQIPTRHSRPGRPLGSRGFHASAGLRQSSAPADSDGDGRGGSGSAPETPRGIPTEIRSGEPSAKQGQDAAAAAAAPGPEPEREPEPEPGEDEPGMDASEFFTLRRERLKSAGYGSARARASRNNRVEEMPPFPLPAWFLEGDVSLRGKRLVGPGEEGAERRVYLPWLDEARRAELIKETEVEFERLSLSESQVARFKQVTTTGGAAPPDTEDNQEDMITRVLGTTEFQREISAVGMMSAGMVDTATSLVLLRDTSVGDRDSHYDTLRRMHRSLFPMKHFPLRWRYLSPQKDMGMTMAEMEEDDVVFALNSSTSWADGEHAATAELLAITAASLAQPPADSSDFSDGLLRPPVVLALIKGDGRGRMLANAVLEEVAVDLEADVVHLSAHSLARLLSRYMGKNAPAAQSSLAMAGYAAAEINGRLVSRSAAEDSENPLKAMTVSLRSLAPSGGTSFSSMNLRDALSSVGSASDGRWEDVKLGAALEKIFEAAETKRAAAAAAAAAAATEGSSDAAVAGANNHNNEKEENTTRDTNNNKSSHNNSSKNNNLIIHLHDYVELSRSQPSLVQRIRLLIDRMWRAGKNVTLIGSSAGDLDKHAWRAELDELASAGARIIPFATAGRDRDVANEEWSSMHENLANIETMLRGVVGDDEVPSNGFVAEYLDAVKKEAAADTCTALPNTDLLRTRLNSGVLDAQWIRRLVSIMVSTGPGNDLREQQKPQEQQQEEQQQPQQQQQTQQQTQQQQPQQQPQPRQYNLTSLADALAFMTTADWHWRKTDPKIASPYFSPLSVPSRDVTLSSIPFGSHHHHHDEDDPHHSAAFKNLTGPAAKHEYKPEEKKLLSGLINAKDIHTTFDQIVVPPETKESLVGLTTLSLLRPEAFAYGVLKTEHIPGCLLYGPPGTGKTLLAKAVAKESGASVLEVSAADINDKWVGQSEKNVQALFSLARKLAPCVIFLDEADALLAARQSSASARSAHRETITQFLREWDGLTGSRAFIMVATNRPFDLDEAVLRRLPRKILVDLPLATEREAILRVILRDETLSPDIDIARLAADTPLYSGSDLKNVCVSAAMEAVREEVRARDAWKGEEPFQFPERRVLTAAHFAKGLRDISASISGDMDSLKAIRKFDEKYGDSGRGKNKRKGIGFGVIEDGAKTADATREARVRKALA